MAPLNIEELHILVIEDNLGDFVLIEDYLMEQMEAPDIAHARNLEQAKSLLVNAGRLDVILLDLSLPDASGEPLVNELLALAGDTVLIVLTGNTNKAFGAKTLSMGVSDYLLKDDLTASQLHKSISYSLERKRFNRRLQENYERYEVVTKATSDAIWDHDFSIGKTYIAGNGYKNLFGYDLVNEYISEEFWQSRLHPDDKERILSMLANAINNEAVTQASYEYRFLKSDGEYAHVNDRFFIIREKGKAMRMLGAKQDVTRQKEEQAEREKMIQQLIQNNADLRQFSYITSHNLRGPVANLLGLTGLVENYAVEDPTLRKILKNIQKATIMFDETIRDLTAVLQVKDRPSLPKENIEIAPVISKVLQQCDVQIKESEAEIQLDLANVQFITFNKAYLESTFINLVSNAIKYRSPNRPLKLRITATQNEKTTEIRFKDNGLGIDTELYRDRLFGLYQRFHDRKDGKGLGLFLVKSQMEALNGTIELESTLGEGSCFILKFNRQQE